MAGFNPGQAFLMSKTNPGPVQGQFDPNVAMNLGDVKNFFGGAGQKVMDFLNRPIMRDPINPATGNDYNYDSMNQDAKQRYQYMLEEMERQKQIELQQHWEQKNLQRSLDFQQSPFDMEPHLQRNRYM
jgi:hypothetical protein